MISALLVRRASVPLATRLTAQCTLSAGKGSLKHPVTVTPLVTVVVAATSMWVTKMAAAATAGCSPPRSLCHRRLPTSAPVPARSIRTQMYITCRGLHGLSVSKAHPRRHVGHHPALPRNMQRSPPLRPARQSHARPRAASSNPCRCERSIRGRGYALRKWHAPGMTTLPGARACNTHSTSTSTSA